MMAYGACEGIAIEKTRSKGFSRTSGAYRSSSTCPSAMDTKQLQSPNAYVRRMEAALRPCRTVAACFLCDDYSVVGEDLLAVDRVPPQYVGEVYYLRHNKDHQWYYLSGQKTDEIASFDSAAGDKPACECLLDHTGISYINAPSLPSRSFQTGRNEYSLGEYRITVHCNNETIIKRAPSGLVKSE